MCTNCVRRQKAGEETQGVGEHVLLLIVQDVARYVSVFESRRREKRERRKAEKERKRLKLSLRWSSLYLIS